MPNHFDVVIIGAGVAGLSAGHAAAARGLSHIVLEAKGRIGGRAFTESSQLGVTMDHGAHYFHAASLNPLREYADKQGFAYKRGYSSRLYSGSWWDQSGHDRFQAVAKAALAEIKHLADTSDNLSSADILQKSGFWARDGHSQYKRIFDGFYAEFMGACPSEVAAGEHRRYVDTYEDWPIEQGCGQLVESYGRNVPVALECPVEAIDYSGPDVRIATPKGTLSARAVVVTVSTGVLARGTIRWTPRLPSATREAIDAIPMGYAGKIAFRINKGPLSIAEPHHGLVCNCRGVFANLHIRPFDRPLVVAIVGGPYWEALERAGSGAMVTETLELVRDIYGGDACSGLGRFMTTSWLRDPAVLGGHSFTRRGHSRARESLATSIDGRVFFAGEATSISGWSTIHGAYESGIRAIGEAEIAWNDRE